MNSRLFVIPALAMLALAAPALAQYQSPRTPPAPAPQLPTPPQAPAPAAPTETFTPSTAEPAGPVALPDIPKHHCLAPEYPGNSASNAKILAFNRDYKTYGDCIKQYVDQNRAWVNAVVEVNNKAVEEYNKYTVELKKVLDAAKE